MDFKPLEGVRVLDFSHVIAGPFASHYLTQMGAEVLKIENPAGGDIMRGSARGAASYATLNAGKTHLSLDITDDADRRRVLDLIADTDVLVDNLKPGALANNGLAPEWLRELNPGLIYCAISGFGRDGDWGKRTAYDHVVQAATGMMLMAGEEGDPPIKTGFPVVDTATGILAALAIVSALRERDRTGEGRFLDVSMSAASLQLMYPFACQALNTGETPARVGNNAYSGSPAGALFDTADGTLALGANTTRQFIALLGVLDLQPLAADPAFFEPPLDPAARAVSLVSKDVEGLRARLAERIREWHGEALEAALIEAGVPASRLLDLAEFARQAEQKGGLERVRLEHEGVSVDTPGLGFRVKPL